MKKLLLLLCLILGSRIAKADLTPSITFVPVDPAGACAPAPLRFNYLNGNLWGCKNGTWALLATAGVAPGTVTSVSGPSIFSWANPTTTPTATLVNQLQNLVFASPNGSTGTPLFRALVVADLPTSIPNANLLNTTITVNSTVCTLGSSCSPGPPAQYKSKSCVIITGDPGAASPVLANDNDSPVACSNDTGSDWTITGVGCWADGGSPTVTPILTGGSGTSILTGALTCGTASWAAGIINGTPVVHSFSAGATCSSTPCTVDSNITVAGGTAKYVVVRIFGTY